MTLRFTAPYLVRSGQQEGQSFLNPDLVSASVFQAGGFDAKYGDKMSSVLDIKYKKPTQFAGSFDINSWGPVHMLRGPSGDLLISLVCVIKPIPTF